MRIDGKEPFPPWLDHLNFLADRVMKLEQLVAKLTAMAAHLPSGSKKATAKKAPPKEDTTKKPPPVPKKSSAKKTPIKKK
jgi:hypothetical protein